VQSCLLTLRERARNQLVTHILNIPRKYTLYVAVCEKKYLNRLILSLSYSKKWWVCLQFSPKTCMLCRQMALWKPRCVSPLANKTS